MGKFFWDPRAQKWVPKSVMKWRSPGPAIHSDVLDALWAPFNGQRYDSKSRMLADAKALGLECVGNDSSIVAPKEREIQTPSGVEQDIARAYDEVVK